MGAEVWLERIVIEEVREIARGALHERVVAV
jgi:hypothetical protein